MNEIPLPSVKFFNKRESDLIRYGIKQGKLAEKERIIEEIKTYLANLEQIEDEEHGLNEYIGITWGQLDELLSKIVEEKE